MKLSKFYVVVKRTADSTEKDLFFEADATTLSTQFRGGLDPYDVVAFYAGPNAESEARTHANEIAMGWDFLSESFAYDPAEEKAKASDDPAGPGISHLGKTGLHGGPRETCFACCPEILTTPEK